MKQLKPLEIFLAATLAISLTACGGAETPEGEEAGEVGEETEETVGEGGEGGEGGEEGHSGHSAASSDPDVSYMVSLGLMKGHMIVAKELLDAGKPEEAEPHIGHPVEEIYGDIEGELEEREVEDFEGTLNEVHDLVKTTPEAPELEEKYQAAIEAIDGAIAAIPEEQLSSTQFVLESINGMLAVADEEYEASLADGKFVELIEYQDSRGFVLYSQELLGTVEDKLAEQDSEAATIIKDSLEELTKAWPSVDAPESPILTPEQVSELVNKIKGASQSIS